MIKIFKYTLKVDDDVQRLSLPIGFNVVSVQAQNDEICLWAEVNPEAVTKPIRFMIFGTGWELEGVEGLHHIGTVQIRGFVWHVYME